MKKILLPWPLLMAVSMLLLFIFPTRAQEKADSVFSFRFLSGNDKFYVPLDPNGKELKSLLDCVERYKPMIMRHEVPVMVNGYSSSMKSVKENMAVAKTRSNRVKSELITRRGLTESCFVTRNHSGGGNYVAVTIAIPRDSVARYAPDVEEKTEDLTAIPTETPETTENLIAPGQTEASLPPAGTVPPQEAERTETGAVEETAGAGEEAVEKEPRDSRIALKTNLLYYAILMPNLEIEWMVADRWSVALEGQIAWYAKEDPHKVYRVATMMPEVRYWPVQRRRWHGMYVGLFGGWGEYDLCDGRKGHEGEGVLAGVSAGYMWPISRYFSLEAGVGVGYMRLTDKEYKPQDGHFLYQLTKHINYIGPLRLKLSLVWRI